MNEHDEGDEVPVHVEESSGPRDRLEREAERAKEGFDTGVVDLLAWLLETETRARIYVHLRRHPGSTSEEVAEGTGLYPSTVREALAELHEEGTVTRSKRESDGAGNNPFAYEAIAPSELVGDVLSQLQDQLNTVVNLDAYLDDEDPQPRTEPITITVDDDEADATDDDTSVGDDEEDDDGDDRPSPDIGADGPDR